jgi:hypothetical protein
MPRVSKRAQAINTLSFVFNNRVKHRTIRLCNDDDDSLEDLKDLATLISLGKIRNRRYLFRLSKYRKSPALDWFKTNLLDGITEEGEGESSSASDSEMPWLSDDEFLQKYRVSRRSFQAILNLIKDHEIFASKTKMMGPPEFQLLVFLKYVGTKGAGANNSNQRSTLGVGTSPASGRSRRRMYKI